MFQSGLPADIFGSSESNFAVWVSTSRRRSLQRLQDLATRMRESESSASWPTPNACERGPENKESKKSTRGSSTGVDLQSVAQVWATPNAKGRASPSVASAKSLAGGGAKDLRNDVKSWPTAQGTDDRNTSGGNGPEANPTLRTAALNWPSDRAEDSEACGNHTNATDSLNGAVDSWASPASRDYKGANGPAHLDRDRPHEDQLPNQAVHLFALPQETTTDDGLSWLLAVWTRPSCPRLSPGFQWWLMRWPHPRCLLATCSASAATEWTRWLSRMRSALCVAIGGWTDEH